MSQAATSPMPPPSAAPWTRAMVGLGISASVRSISARARASSQVLVDAVVGGALHPVEVGAGAEALAAPGEHDDAHLVVVGIEGDAGGGQFGDQRVVEGIVPLGTVHPDRRDRGRSVRFRGS